MVYLESSLLLLLFCFNVQLNYIWGKGSHKKCSYILIDYAYRYTYLSRSLTFHHETVLLKLQCTFEAPEDLVKLEILSP